MSVINPIPELCLVEKSSVLKKKNEHYGIAVLFFVFVVAV